MHDEENNHDELYDWVCVAEDEISVDLMFALTFERAEADAGGSRFETYFIS